MAIVPDNALPIDLVVQSGLRGVGIASIEKTSTEGLVDTHTITYTDGTTSTFEVTNGVGGVVDSALDTTSENPVQNKVVTEALDAKQDGVLVYDSIGARDDGTYVYTTGMGEVVLGIREAVKKGQSVRVVEALGMNDVIEYPAAKNITNWMIISGGDVFGYTPDHKVFQGTYNATTKKGGFILYRESDDSLNATSFNSVQNKVLYAELTAIKARLDALEGGSNS